MSLLYFIVEPSPISSLQPTSPVHSDNNSSITNCGSQPWPESDLSVGNLLRRHSRAPYRHTEWEFLRQGLTPHFGEVHYTYLPSLSQLPALASFLPPCSLPTFSGSVQKYVQASQQGMWTLSKPPDSLTYQYPSHTPHSAPPH